MPRTVITYRVRCAMCGLEFEAKRANATTCSATCRKAKSDEAKRARAVVAKASGLSPSQVKWSADKVVTNLGPDTPPTPEAPPEKGAVLLATEAALPEGVPAWERANVLAVARRLDDTGSDTASAVATLSKRYEELMRRLVPDTAAGDDLNDILGGAA